MWKLSSRKSLGYAAVVGATAASAAAIALPGAFAGGAPAPFFAHGTNGVSGSNGSAKQIDEGAGGQGALLTSVGSGYGNVGVNGGDGTAKTFDGLKDVETQFNVTQGACAAGSPYWVIHVVDPKSKNTQSLLVHFDTSHDPYGGCDPGTHQEGNIIADPTTGWFDGYHANAPSTYSQVEQKYGTWALKNVEVVVEAGYAQNGPLNPNVQQVLLQNLKINSASYFKIPS